MSGQDLSGLSVTQLNALRDDLVLDIAAAEAEVPRLGTPEEIQAKINAFKKELGEVNEAIRVATIEAQTGTQLTRRAIEQQLAQDSIRNLGDGADAPSVA